MYMDMEQWARVGRKVLMEGRSKRSVMKEEKLHWGTPRNSNAADEQLAGFPANGRGPARTGKGRGG